MDSSAVGWLSGSSGVDHSHQPDRPSWKCTHCREPWPCVWAKAAITADSGGDRISVGQRMAAHMHEAAEELPGATPKQLWDRFLAWVDEWRRAQQRARRAESWWENQDDD